MIADRIRVARRAAGLTQIELADLACISLQHIRFIEQQRRNPSESVLAMLERVLGVDLRGAV